MNTPSEWRDSYTPRQIQALAEYIEYAVEYTPNAHGRALDLLSALAGVKDGCYIGETVSADRLGRTPLFCTVDKLGVPHIVQIRNPRIWDSHDQSGENGELYDATRLADANLCKVEYFIAPDAEHLAECDFHGLCRRGGHEIIGEFLGYPEPAVEAFTGGDNAAQTDDELCEALVDSGELSEDEARLAALPSYSSDGTPEGIRRAVDIGEDILEACKTFDEVAGTDVATRAARRKMFSESLFSGDEVDEYREQTPDPLVDVGGAGALIFDGVPSGEYFIVARTWYEDAEDERYYVLRVFDRAGEPYGYMTAPEAELAAVVDEEYIYGSIHKMFEEHPRFFAFVWHDLISQY